MGLAQERADRHERWNDYIESERQADGRPRASEGSDVASGANVPGTVAPATDLGCRSYYETIEADLYLDAAALARLRAMR